MRALYRIPGHRRPENRGNTGLWYDKFCDKWPEDDSGWSLSVPEGQGDNAGRYPKLAWIETVTGRPVGNEDEIQEECQRLAKLAKAITEFG